MTDTPSKTLQHELSELLHAKFGMMAASLIMGKDFLAIIDKHMCSAGDAALLAEAANMLEQVIEAAEIAMKDVNAESSSDVWDVNHLLGPARGVLARCRAAHAAENIPATSPTLEMVKQAKEAIEENTRSPKEPQTVEHGWGGTGPKPSAPHAESIPAAVEAEKADRARDRPVTRDELFFEAGRILAELTVWADQHEPADDDPLHGICWAAQNWCDVAKQAEDQQTKG